MVKKILIMLAIIVAVGLIGYVIIFPLLATKNILNISEDTKISSAMSEANMVVNNIDNYCATQKMMVSLNDNVVECKRYMQMSDFGNNIFLGNATVRDITFDLINNKVIEITVVSGGYTIIMTSGVWGEPTK